MALQFAFVLPPFLLLILGALEFGRGIWLQSSLQFAVEEAARCAVVDPVTCAPDKITAYAVARANAKAITASAFSVNTAAACGSLTGTQVSGTVNVALVPRQILPFTLALQATSCYPQ